MRFEVGCVCFVFAVAGAAHAAVKDGSHQCEPGENWDGTACWPEPEGGGGGEIIEINGSAPDCPIGHVWNGFSCDLDEEPISPGDGDIDDGPLAGDPICTPEDVCRDCKEKADLCAKKAGALAENVKQLLEQQAFDNCDLNRKGRKPEKAEAKGGHYIHELSSGKSVISTFAKEDWSFDCSWSKEEGVLKPTRQCEGPAEYNCMASYRKNFPDLATTASQTLSLELSAGWMGMSGGAAESVTYQYGGSTGYKSAVDTLKSTLLTKCAGARATCQGDQLCEGF